VDASPQSQGQVNVRDHLVLGDIAFPRDQFARRIVFARRRTAMLDGANLCPWKGYNLDIHEALLLPCGFFFKPHPLDSGPYPA